MADLARPKNPPPRDRLISPAERNTLMVALGYSEDVPVILKQHYVGLAFQFAIQTAMRAGEICGLLPQDIALTERFVSLGQTKNGTSRKVALSKEACRLLERSKPWAADKPVFQLTSGSLSTQFRSAALRAGIEGLTFHDTRHEAITRLASKLDVLDLARMVGHKDIKQLMTYYNKTAQELATQLD